MLFDPAMFVARRDAPRSRVAAAEFLKLFAAYLRENAASFPIDSANFVADAFEATARARGRLATLALHLHLTAKGQRPKIDSLHLALVVDARKREGINKAIAKVAEEHDVSQPTVRRAWKAHCKAIEDYRKID